jgi:catechol 2,3-dioxygenase-like lactoylglutathione lyase family enzyme
MTEADHNEARSGPADVRQDVPLILGLHHVRLPVSDVLRSRDWYCEVLGFEPILDYQEEYRLVGVAVQHRVGVTLGLHLDPERAAALRGFAVVALRVAGPAVLEDWSTWLDELGAEHSPVVADHAGGWSMRLVDPDGIGVQFHTMGHPTADDA